MLVDMMKPEDVEMQSLIDEYLTEDDKSLVFKKVQSNKAMGIHGGNSFVLYSNANKVKEFVENGHYVQFIAYGIDYMILKESGTFTLRANDFDSIDQLTEFTRHGSSRQNLCLAIGFPVPSNGDVRMRQRPPTQNSRLSVDVYGSREQSIFK